MIEVFERAKVVYYFENMEEEKLETLTITDLHQDADSNLIESVGDSLDSLSDLPLAYAQVEVVHRFIK